MIIPIEIQKRLIENAVMAKADTSFDPFPPLKIFTPSGPATWLISEMDPTDNDLVFGLADLGIGEPELGGIRLSELVAIEWPFGMTVEIDKYWKPKMTVRQYANEAAGVGRIVA